MRILITSLCAVVSCCAMAQDGDYRSAFTLYKEGSWCKVKMDMGGMNMVMKQTLKKVTDEEIVIANETEMMGRTQTNEQKIDLKKKDENKPKEVGKGEVEIEKKIYKCKILEVSGQSLGMGGGAGGPGGAPKEPKKGKVWVCDELKDKIYSGAVKMESDNSTITCTKLSEKITVGGKELECAVFEGDMNAPGGQGKGKMKLWQACEYPGFQFKTEMTFSIQGQERTMTMEATEWDIKKK